MTIPPNVRHQERFSKAYRGARENKKWLRKTTKGLGIDHASLYRSLKDGSNIKLERVKQFLDYFGYEIWIVRK